MATKDDFVKELIGRQTGTSRKCAVGRFLDNPETPKDLRAGIVAALNTPTIYAQTIADVLTENGFPCTDKPVWRHRKGQCACPKEAT